MHDYMSKTKEMLLKKFIDFDSMWQFDSENIRQKVYRLLFEWKEGKREGLEEKLEEGLLKDKEHLGKEDGASQKDEEDADNDKNEKKKRQQLKLDQELFEFEERGGFAQVLKDIFNPSDQSSMELDSVFQLKQLCKAFYTKKENLSSALIQCLDALANERPWTMKVKKKHFDTSSNNLLTDIEYMRINAERERIKKYQEITKSSAYVYYKILKRLSEESVKQMKENINNQRDSQDPQVKIKLALQDAKIKNLLHYMTGKSLF